jgi:hypothetical protein
VGRFDSCAFRHNFYAFIRESGRPCLAVYEDIAGSNPAERAMRAWYIGCALGFQPREVSSSLTVRSILWVGVREAEEGCL